MEIESDEADQQIVLEEEIDENYEPTDSEIQEYAKWLGMDLENEKELLWIAREGLKAPLPDDWKPCQALPSKEIYYFNFATGESIWDHPCDAHYRTLYQREKARLQDMRMLGAQQQQQQQRPPLPPQQSQQQQQDAGAGAMQQQAGLVQQQQQLNLSAASAVTHTPIEPLQLPLSSPTGTLSTLPSATTGSLIESPIGGVARDSSMNIFRETSAKDGSQAAGPPVLSRAAPSAGAPAAATTSTSDAALTAAAAPHWQAAADTADREQRQLYRQHLDEQRRAWEQQLHDDLEQQQARLQEQQKSRLWGMQRQLQEQAEQIAQTIRAEHDVQLQQLHSELEDTANRQQRELQDSRQQHASKMAELQAQQAIAEANASATLQQAQALLTTSTLSDGEISALKEKAAAAAEVQAQSAASAKAAELLTAAMHKVDEQIAAEVDVYRSTRRAAVLRELVGQLQDDEAAAAEKLEQQTAELQRLEAAVADKAAVLQKLTEQVDVKQNQANSSNPADALAATMCNQQLSSLQQQVQQSHKHLESADTALAAQRAAAAEAEEQLAALKQDISVCEPRLTSLRQQLQQMDSNIRLCEAEHQQRKADVALATRRLSELRQDIERRQNQLESLEALHSEKQEALRAATAELAKRRGELSTLEGGLSDTLRRKTDVEFQAVEDQLRRTRRAAAEAAAELAAKQISLTATSTQLAASQAQLGSVEASLAAKRKELSSVLGQLQAAAAQEFQDAKKLLLEEESRLLDSERRTMQARAADQLEAERRALLAAGRRRIEREVGQQVAEEQAALLANRQEEVKKWLYGEGCAQQAVLAGLHNAGSSAMTTAADNSISPAAAAAGIGVRRSAGSLAALAAASAAVDSAAHELGQLQHGAGCATHSVQSLPVQGAFGESSPATAAGVTRRRSRSLSPGVQRARASSSPVITLQQLTQEQVQQLNLPVNSGVMPESRPNKSPSRAGIAAAAAAAAGVPEVGSAAAVDVASAVQLLLQALTSGSSLGADGTSCWARVLAGINPQPDAMQNRHVSRPSKGFMGPELSAYSSLLQHAKQFVRQRRRDIQQQQAAIVAAQTDWKATLAALEQQQQQGNSDVHIAQAAQQVRELKLALQEQIHQLNNEIRQVKALKVQVQQLETHTAELGQQEAAQQQQQQHDHAIASMFASLSSASLQQQQQHRQTSGVAFTPMPPLYMRQHNAQQLPLSSTPERESSLDRVAAALQQALNVATSVPGNVSTVLSNNDSSAPGSRRATGVNARLGQHRTTRSVPHVLGMDPPGQGPCATATATAAAAGSQPECATSLVYLDKLREEQSVAQHVMQQHSQWLQGFREQVANVARTLQQSSSSNVNGVQQQRFSSSQLAALGAELSPVASSSILMTPRSGQAMTLDLGNQQRLVISLEQKPV